MIKIWPLQNECKLYKEIGDVQSGIGIQKRHTGKYFYYCKKIFVDEGMTCFLDENGKQIFTDSEDTGFMNIGASLIRSYEEIPNISTMLNRALWFHNKKCENLMETFYCEDE